MIEMQIIILEFVYVKAIILKKRGGGKLQLKLGKGDIERKRNNMMNMVLHRFIFFPCMKDIIPDTSELVIFIFFKLPGAWKTKACPIIKLPYKSSCVIFLQFLVLLNKAC